MTVGDDSQWNEVPPSGLFYVQLSPREAGCSEISSSGAGTSNERALECTHYPLTISSIAYPLDLRSLTVPRPVHALPIDDPTESAAAVETAIQVQSFSSSPRFSSQL